MQSSSLGAGQQLGNHRHLSCYTLGATAATLVISKMNLLGFSHFQCQAIAYSRSGSGHWAMAA